MQSNYASFNGLPLIISAPKLAVSYLWHAQDHSILRDVFFGARQLIYCQTLGNKPNHSYRVLRGRLFSNGKS